MAFAETFKALSDPVRRRILELLKNDNAQGEYYLTDVPELMRQRGGKIGLCCVELGMQIIGVNTPQQLQEVEDYLRCH